MSSITGRVIGTKRAGHSNMGNPAFDVLIDNGVTAEWYRTSSNVGLAYGIENPEYREHSHTFGLTRVGRLNGTATRVEGVSA